MGAVGERTDSNPSVGSVGGASRTTILERIASDAPLDGTLDEIVEYVEQRIDGAVGSCLLLDDARSRLLSASCRGLAPEYNAAIDGIGIGPTVGSCGAAAATGEPVFVTDIRTSSNWAPFAALAEAHGLRACWSVPIRARRRQEGPPVLGTFAVYFREPRAPTPEETGALARAEHLACIAIEADRSVRALRDEEARFRTFVDRAHDAFYVHDFQRGSVVDVSHRACEMLGYSRAELIGADPTLYAPKLDEATSRNLAARLAAGELVTFESHHRRKDGTSFPVEVQLRSFEHHGRKQTLAVVRDTTERKRLEAQLGEAQKMDAVGRLAGGIAHDFNNLLTVINSSADLVLAMLPDDSPVRTDVENIRDAGERAASLTSQLLAFGRRSIVEPRALDLNAEIEKMLLTFGRLLGPKIVIVRYFDPAIPPILADKSHLDQVVLNLIVNARDAMAGEGKIMIRTEATRLVSDESPAGPAADGVALTISDTGVGMDEAQMARAFEPFFSTKGPSRGTGLGLATVYGIMKQAGGSIRVDSRLGEGSRFVATFRSAVEAPTAARKAAPAAAPGHETILLVEDEPGVRRLTERLLTLGGYRVLAAGDGEEAMAIAAAHEGDIHLLLSDVMMPGMGGREAAKLIACSRPAMRTLFMSGYTDDEALRLGIDASEVSLLQKPFSPATLGETVRRILDARD